MKSNRHGNFIWRGKRLLGLDGMLFAKDGDLDDDDGGDGGGGGGGGAV